MKLIPPLEGILFDFDGLILDTETPVFQAWDEKFKEYGKEMLLEDWGNILGKTGKKGGPIEAFLETFRDKTKQAEIIQEVSGRELALVLKQKPLPGVVSLIKRAKKRGLKLGIVSSSDQEWVHTNLGRLGLLVYFDHTSCAEEVEEGKPHPALYQLGLEKIECPAEKVLVLEDSPNGVLAAKRAGLYCIAVPNDVSSRLPFNTNGGTPDRILASLQDFPWDEYMKEN